MRVAIKPTITKLQVRLAGEEGFTIMLALGVLVVTSLLAAGAYAAVQADAPLAQRDLSGKRAYYAARSGLAEFSYELSQNPNLWQKCPSQPVKTQIAPNSGKTTAGTTVVGAAEYYTYKPVPANTTGSSPANPTAICDPADHLGSNGLPDGTHGDPIKTFIDTTSGTFQMQFTGYAGCSTSATCPAEVSRGIIATFRKPTPLDYLWFTIYETLDPATYPSYDPSKPTQFPQTCNVWERDGRSSNCKDIQWVTGDALKGPAYTADQYLISGSPHFGRVNKSDRIESSNPNNPTLDDSICFNNDCTSAVYETTTKKAPNAETISPPSTNLKLLDDAKLYGGGVSGPADGPPGVQTGVTFITLQSSPSRALITNCPTSGCTAQQSVPLGPYPNGTPIIYVRNAATGCSPTYTPYAPTYPATGACGTVYVQGSYSSSLTIASQSDIIVNGDITRVGSAPAPTLGLVANNFVRVEHGINGRPATPTESPPGSGNFTCGPLDTPDPARTHKDLHIDAAILAIQHSFIVDNYDCGDAADVNYLHVTGAIAQNFRGTVGTGGSQGASTGYLKDYNYDDRFTVAQPPYLFDIASSTWHIARETLCVPSSTTPGTGCDAPAS
jgi:hypothetical protein